MRFCVCTTKWKWRKLSFSTWKFHWCVWHIIYVLNMILTLHLILLNEPFSIITLIHHSIFTCWIWNMFLELPCKNDVCVHSGGMHCRMWVIRWCTRQLQCCNQYQKKPFAINIQTIKNLSDMYWWSNTTINYNIICMCQHWEEI